MTSAVIDRRYSGITVVVAATITWIRERYSDPPEVSGPLVMGAHWMLEMHRRDDGSRTFGLFLAAFDIVQLGAANFKTTEFVGFSTPGKPPADWLTATLIFEMGTMPLAETPEELITLVEKPRPYISLEVGLHASPLSKRARMRLAETYQDGISISDVARELGVSHAHLTRQFRRDFGLTPVSYRPPSSQRSRSAALRRRKDPGRGIRRGVQRRRPILPGLPQSHGNLSRQMP